MGGGEREQERVICHCFNTQPTPATRAERTLELECFGATALARIKNEKAGRERECEVCDGAGCSRITIFGVQDGEVVAEGSELSSQLSGCGALKDVTGRARLVTMPPDEDDGK